MLLRFLGVSLAMFAITVISTLPAQARHYRHHGHQHHARFMPGHHVAQKAPVSAGMIYDNDGRIRNGGGMPEFSSLVAAPPQRAYEGRGRVQQRGHARRVPRSNDESSTSLRGGLAHVCVSGHCGTVAAQLAEKFRGLFADFVALGYNIGSPGCLSSGHMRHSLHHWGGACDIFNQRARNVTSLPQPPPAVQIEVAARHGLTAGASWCNPDGGHFDASGYNGCHGGRAHVRRARIRTHRHIARNY